MKKLRSIHVTPGTAGANYLDTTLALHGAEDGYSSSVTVTAGELACAAFEPMAMWLLTEAQQEGWSLQRAVIERNGEVPISPIASRTRFALALTLTKDAGERTTDRDSERVPDSVRDALHVFWPAAELALNQ